jgi:hypothetical protein
MASKNKNAAITAVPRLILRGFFINPPNLIAAADL